MDCSESSWRLLATHSIRLFPLHFSSRASPCATRFRFHHTAYHPRRLESPTTPVWEYPLSPNKPLYERPDWLSLLFYTIYVAAHSYITPQCERTVTGDLTSYRWRRYGCGSIPRGILYSKLRMFHESQTGQTFNSYSWKWWRKCLKIWDSKTNDRKMLSHARFC